MIPSIVSLIPRMGNNFAYRKFAMIRAPLIFMHFTSFSLFFPCAHKPSLNHLLYMGLSAYTHSLSALYFFCRQNYCSWRSQNGSPLFPLSAFVVWQMMKAKLIAVSIFLLYELKWTIFLGLPLLTDAMRSKIEENDFSLFRHTALLCSSHWWRILIALSHISDDIIGKFIPLE